jgi:hypothetical protein
MIAWFMESVTLKSTDTWGTSTRMTPPSWDMNGTVQHRIIDSVKSGIAALMLRI